MKGGTMREYMHIRNTEYEIPKHLPAYFGVSDWP